MEVHANGLSLRSFSITDADVYFRHVYGDALIQEYVPFAYPRTLKEAYENVVVYSQGDCNNDFYLVIEKNYRAVGAIIAVKMSSGVYDKNKSLDVSAMVFKTYRRQGIMTEAMNLFITFLKERTDYTELSLTIKKDNEASIKQAKKLGAVFCKELEDEKIYKIYLQQSEEETYDKKPETVCCKER